MKTWLFRCSAQFLTKYISNQNFIVMLICWVVWHRTQLRISLAQNAVTYFVSLLWFINCFPEGGHISSAHFHREEVREARAQSWPSTHARAKEISCIRIHLCPMHLHLSLAQELVYCRRLRQSPSSGTRAPKTRGQPREISVIVRDLISRSPPVVSGFWSSSFAFHEWDAYREEYIERNLKINPTNSHIHGYDKLAHDKSRSKLVLYVCTSKTEWFWIKML